MELAASGLRAAFKKRGRRLERQAPGVSARGPPGKAVVTLMKTAAHFPTSPGPVLWALLKEGAHPWVKTIHREFVPGPVMYALLLRDCRLALGIGGVLSAAGCFPAGESWTSPPPAACQGRAACWAAAGPGGQPPARFGKQGAWKKKSLEFYKVVTTVGLYVIKPKCHFPPKALG